MQYYYHIGAARFVCVQQYSEVCQEEERITEKQLIGKLRLHYMPFLEDVYKMNFYWNYLNISLHFCLHIVISTQ